MLSGLSTDGFSWWPLALAVRATGAQELRSSGPAPGQSTRITFPPLVHCLGFVLRWIVWISWHWWHCSLLNILPQIQVLEYSQHPVFPRHKGVPDRESRTGTRLVSPAVSHEKKNGTLCHTWLVCGFGLLSRVLYDILFLFYLLTVRLVR